MYPQNTSTSPFPVLNVGAVSPAHFMDECHVIVLALLACTTFRVNALTLPLAAGLAKLIVVFSVSVWLKLLAVRRLIDTALLLDVTAAYSSLKPLSKVITPLASAVTVLLAWDRPKVVMSL